MRARATRRAGSSRPRRTGRRGPARRPAPAGRSDARARRPPSPARPPPGRGRSVREASSSVIPKFDRRVSTAARRLRQPGTTVSAVPVASAWSSQRLTPVPVAAQRRGVGQRQRQRRVHGRERGSCSPSCRKPAAAPRSKNHGSRTAAAAAAAAVVASGREQVADGVVDAVVAGEPVGGACQDARAGRPPGWRRSASRSRRWQRYHCRSSSRAATNRSARTSSVEHLGRARDLQRGVAQRTRQALERRRPHQQVALSRGQPGQHLRRRSSRAGAGRRRADGRGSAPAAPARPVAAPPPSPPSVPQRRRGGSLEVDARHARQQGGRLVGREPQLRRRAAR